MKRYLEKYIKHDIKSKIVIISGPRQVGKTTLAKMIENDYEYLNYDFPEHRLIIHRRSWNRKKKMIIFDEIHKMKEWKNFLKGIYDVEGLQNKIIVTGSFRLRRLKKQGDSLAGRFFEFRLFPVDIFETKNENDFEKLLKVSGFPEPFLKNKENFYKRWRRSHYDIILRKDLLETEKVSDIPSIELLSEILREKVGSLISYSNLSGDLEKSPTTVKRWLEILENLYLIFKITPYHRNIARSILKAPKYYFFDTAIVKGGMGAKVENMVALSLYKYLAFLEDTKGYETSLHFLRNKEKKEMDFYVKVEENEYLIEVKAKDNKKSKNFEIFKKYFPNAKSIQLVLELRNEEIYPDGTEIRDLKKWLKNIDSELK